MTRLPRIRRSLPWLSFTLGPILLAYLFIIDRPFIAQDLNIPERYLQTELQGPALLLFLLVMLLDTLLAGRKDRQNRERMLAYEQQFSELLNNKSRLQNKAHLYAAHADKLKMFISERLLEHIEYDEKFLHFKNIASEVRHNGVISYDKVGKALQLAREHDGENTGAYQQALQSMGYLWDLLDLATTDNIAMHIADGLYQAEEQYYQQMLSEEPSPFSPSFRLQSAIIDCLKNFLQEPSAELDAALDEQEGFRYRDERFALQLEPVDALLGKPNHMILMLENLLNNALYYAEQKRYHSVDSRIVVRLYQDTGIACLSIANRGPHIDADTMERLFQLGFSTKRVRENHGKGLGLYFVHEIVKGYEGRIHVENIHNPQQTYRLTITLGNGEVVEHELVVHPDEQGRPLCSNAGEEQSAGGKDLRIPVTGTIKAVEIKPLGEDKNSPITDLRGEQVIYDPLHEDQPQWRLTIKQHRKAGHLLFHPLNIAGVRFEIRIPTISARLDANYHDMDEDTLDNLDELGKEFAGVKEYTR